MEELLLELVTAGLLAVIGWIDGRTMEIPYALSGALAICALADFFLFPGLPVGERLMGMVCVSVPMYTLCMVVKEAFGGGDILLLSIMGFYLGWRALLPGVFIGFLLGGLEAVWFLASGRAKPGEGAHMAFGPVPGTWDQPVLWREDLFLVCGAFWLSTRRETYIWKAFKEKRNGDPGSWLIFFSRWR